MAISNSQARRDALKAYIIQAVSDGVFAGITSPAAIAKKAAAIFAVDLPAVIKDLANQATESGFRNLTVMAMGKLEEIAGDIGKRGLGAVWGDLQAQYARGMDANAKRRNR